MKKFLQVITIFVLIFFSFSSVSYGKDIVTFTEYSSQLGEILYPKIDKFLVDYNRDLTNKEVLTIERKVLEIMTNFIKENNIPIVHFPRVEVMAAENPEYKGWVLFTEIDIMDEEESVDGEIITWSVFGKSFVIHLKVKNKVEI